VHATLRQLEHTARVPLFEKSRRGTRLTEAGELLLQRARLALSELRNGHDELAAFRGLLPGRVTVGALPMTSDVLVPQSLARLFGAEPGVRVIVVDGTYEALLHALRHGDVDLVVGPLRGDRTAGDVVEELLFVDRLLPVVRAGHPLIGALRKRCACWLAWIGPLPGTPARAAFERAFAAAGLTAPEVGLQVNSPSVVRSMLLAGNHVALVSPLQIRAELAAGVLILLPVPVTGTERAIGITQRRGGLASPTSNALVRELRAVAGEERTRS
jgi:LysR family transcriptional regulator of gallate degradation